jgi:quaternary ammonium compound-resistance protein SugE
VHNGSAVGALADATALCDSRAISREIRMAWLLLFGAGLLEIVWAIALKYSEGFTRLWPSTIGIVAALASFLMLTMALKSLPVGTAYAVWVGIGAVGVALVGIVAFNEAASLARLSLLALILIGIIGLKAIES